MAQQAPTREQQVDGRVSAQNRLVAGETGDCVTLCCVAFRSCVLQRASCACARVRKSIWDSSVLTSLEFGKRAKREESRKVARFAQSQKLDSLLDSRIELE